jgi:hypothetical protein
LTTPAVAGAFASVQSVTYVVGGHEFSLDDIENGVLRGNRRSPSGLSSSDLPFGSGDARAVFSLSICDPRVHFALVCGAKSCPPIKLYAAANCDEALTLATESFVEGDLFIDMAKASLTVSKVMSWYMVDFGGTTKSLLQFLLGYCDRERQKPYLLQLLRAIDYGHSVSLKFRPYNCEINSKG